MDGQLSIYDLLESDLACDNCIFDTAGCCDHISGCEDGYVYHCVEGSFRLRHGSEICPACGKTMEIVQSEFGSDWARCRCGTSVIFNNQGNRLGHLEAWRRGLLVGG